MKIIEILRKGGQKHVKYIVDGAKEAKVKPFPETYSRKEIEDALKKLDAPVKPGAPAPKKS